MKISIVRPSVQDVHTGNRQTASRWAGILGELGHEPAIADEYGGEDCDLLVALHAFRSAPSITRFTAERGGAPLVVALTGTDLYHFYGESEYRDETKRSLEVASRLIVLQPLGVDGLEPGLRSKARVILQSVVPIASVEAPSADSFDVCVIGHLRVVKDSFRAVEAVRELPESSSVRLLQVGAALEPEMERRARREEEECPRYTWLGARPHEETLAILARSRLLVLPSVMEGGAHVIGEAVVHGVPVLASRIPGSVGLLGEDYPGYFRVGDTEELTALIRRAETDAGFHADLRARCSALAGKFSPAREREAWRELLAELGSAPC